MFVEGASLVAAGRASRRGAGSLVDLALWIAEVLRARDRRRSSRSSLQSERTRRGDRQPRRSATPSTRTTSGDPSDAQEHGARSHRRRARRRGRSRSPLRGNREREDRGLPPCLPGGARARARARSCSCRRSRSRRRRSVASARASVILSPCIHSGLTDAERRDERERIATGDARIVVGARSAVFAPVRGFGVICIDEEHDSSYKQDSDPTVRRTNGGRETCDSRGTPSPSTEARPLAGELAPSRAPRARWTAGRAASGRSVSSTCAGRRLPALRAAARAARPGGRGTEVARFLLLNRRGVSPPFTAARAA